MHANIIHCFFYKVTIFGVRLWEFINKVLLEVGQKPIHKKVSFKIAYFLGALVEVFYTLFRLKSDQPPMTRFVACQLGLHHYYSHQKAFIELGYQPILNYEDSIKNLV